MQVNSETPFLTNFFHPVPERICVCVCGVSCVCLCVLPHTNKQFLDTLLVSILTPSTQRQHLIMQAKGSVPTEHPPFWMPIVSLGCHLAVTWLTGYKSEVPMIPLGLVNDSQNSGNPLTHQITDILQKILKGHGLNSQMKGAQGEVLRVCQGDIWKRSGSSLNVLCWVFTRA